MWSIKYLFFLLLVFTIANSVKAQAVAQGETMITPYWGPALFKKSFNPYDPKNAHFPTNDYTHRCAGAFGITAERMIHDMVGLGVEFFYRNSEFSWSDQVKMYDSLQNSTITKQYHYKISAPTFAAMLRFNLHFSSYYGFFNDVFDSYLFLSFGLRKTFYDVRTSDPDFVLQHEKTFGYIDLTRPYGGRFGAGFRYFPSETIGINLELGAGIPLVNVGITFRFENSPGFKISPLK